MRKALNEIVIDGIQTTIPFHLALLDNPRFISGDYDTGFLEEEKII